MLTLIVYTVRIALMNWLFHSLFVFLKQGYGVTAWPMDLVKGRRSVTKELSEVSAERTQVQTKIEALRNKVSLPY
jgi:hypothetical protein